MAAEGPLQSVTGSFRMPAFEHARVVDAMRPGIISVAPDTSLETLARTMASYHIHCVVLGGVAAEAGHGEELVWGLVSDMDLLRAASSGEAGEPTARQLAASPVVTVEPGDTLVRAAQLMAEHDTAHVVVVEAGRPVGVLSTLDVAGVIAWGRG